MDEQHRYVLERELDDWHRNYLPIGRVVLDIGAGNGETAQFYLNHGAEHVICIEPDANLLYENFGSDSRVTIVPMAVNSIKSDCEGGEMNMVIETHFPFYLKPCDASSIHRPLTNLWKLVPIPLVGRLGIHAESNLMLLRIQLSNLVRRGRESIRPQKAQSAH
jgi:hypothetical protein